jgi:hypothetical protein
MEIKHPEWLQIAVDNQKLYGYNQEWYQTSCQRTRGCGPTAAAMLFLYLNIREANPLSYQSQSISSIRQVLEDIWSFVTPGRLLGLNSTKKFSKGLEAFLGHHGLNWRCHALRVTMVRSQRATLSQVVEFLEAGISSDCPIAFLNLHKGQVTAFASWHWIVLVALTYDAVQNRYMATCYDGGGSTTFDLGLWLQTSRFGGGFVYVAVAAKSVS